MKLFLRIVVVYMGIIGLVSLLYPQAGASNLGHALNSFELFIARSLGALLITIAIINWLLSTAPPAIVRGLLWGNLFMNTVLAVIDIIALSGHVIDASAWSGISVRVLLCFGSLYYIFIARHRNTKEQV